MKRTAIYMRVSSDKQAQEGDSIPAQRDALRKYIDAHDDMICVGEYLDDGISGTKEDRDELQRMLADVREGKIDLILVTKLDRLYRSIRHYLNLQDTLDRHGVNWTAIWESIYDTTTPQGRLIINQMMSIAQFEAEQTGQRIRQVQSYKVSQGEVISGSTPPGLKIVDKHLVPDEHADDVRQVFEHYAKHGNLYEASRFAMQFGCFPHGRTALKALLQNTKYIGEFRGNEHFCEPIIDRELFDAVQRQLSMNVKISQKRTYIFSGLVVCAECGHRMGAFMYIDCRNQKRTKMYRCPHRYNRADRACANTKHLAEHKLEEYLLENIRPMIRNLILDIEIEEKPKKDSRKQLAMIDRKLDRLKELFMNDLISIEEYKADRERLLSEKDSICPVEPVSTDNLKKLLSTDIESLYCTFTDDEKRFFWRSVIKEIRFDARRRIDIIFLR